MQQFQIIAKVGQGSFASVYKVKRKEDGHIYALKKIKISNSNTKQMSNTLNQVRILASICNPYILSYKEATYDENIGCLLLITEFASGGDLTGYIQSHRKRKQYIPENQIWRMSIQMAHGLRALHKMNIFHRDIKSANIMLTKDNQSIKLGDMNISKISKSGLACTQTGTPYYASPEVWSDLPYNGKCDIWSLGCVLYEMTSYRPPFMASDMPSLRKKIIAGHYQRIPSQYSEDLQNFIRLCLTTSPKERPSAQGLLHTTYIRKRIYTFPKQKFNESAYDGILNKENILLQTIRIPSRKSIGDELKFKLPKSNYDSDGMKVMTERNKSVCIVKDHNEGFPELKKRNSSRQVIKEKINIPKPKLIYLR